MRSVDQPGGSDRCVRSVAFRRCAHVNARWAGSSGPAGVIRGLCYYVERDLAVFELRFAFIGERVHAFFLILEGKQGMEGATFK